MLQQDAGEVIVAKPQGHDSPTVTGSENVHHTNSHLIGETWTAGNIKIDSKIGGKVGTTETIQQALDAVSFVPSPVNQPAKSAQELLENPGEMRKLFPQVLKDLKGANSSHINMDDINKGLANSNLSDLDKNFLTALKAEYKPASHSAWSYETPWATLTPSVFGINESSLAMLDKSVNRTSSDDPYFWHHVKADAIAGATLGAIYGAGTSAYYHAPTRSAVYVTAFCGLAGAVAGSSRALLSGLDGHEDKMYDKIKADYKTAVKDFESNKSLEK